MVYGYKYVSSTEYYHGIFHAASLNGTWFCVQLSNNPCKLTAGCFADNKLVLLGKGCGSANSGTSGYGSGCGYAYVSTIQTVSFTEYNFTMSVFGPRGLCFGDCYWAFADHTQYIWYTDGPVGTWTKQSITSSTVYLQDMCYGDGTWCVVGWQSSGGLGRLFYAASVKGAFKDLGTTDANDGNQAVAYADGVFLVLVGEFSSPKRVLVSADHFVTRKSKQVMVNGWRPSCNYALVGNGEQWLACGVNDVITIRHPEADAVLPELKPEFGTTYVKAK